MSSSNGSHRFERAYEQLAALHDAGKLGAGTADFSRGSIERVKRVGELLEPLLDESPASAYAIHPIAQGREMCTAYAIHPIVQRPRMCIPRPRAARPAPSRSRRCRRSREKGTIPLRKRRLERTNRLLCTPLLASLRLDLPGGKIDE